MYSRKKEPNQFNLIKIFITIYVLLVPLNQASYIAVTDVSV